jgi:hypothetical protein
LDGSSILGLLFHQSSPPSNHTFEVLRLVAWLDWVNCVGKDCCCPTCNG